MCMAYMVRTQKVTDPIGLQLERPYPQVPVNPTPCLEGTLCQTQQETSLLVNNF